MDKLVNVGTEPSIGQAEYLKYLRAMAEIEMPSFMLVELELSECDLNAVEKTIHFFLRRHESLRTVFPLIDDEIRLMVLPVEDPVFGLEYVRVEDNGDFVAIRKVHFDRAAELFSNIEKGPMVKFVMFDRSDGQLFSLLIHHIICDEWSCDLIRQELIMIYESYLNGTAPDMPALPLQLKDYCNRQNAWLRGNKRALSIFWQEKLYGFDSIFDVSGFRRGYALRNQEAPVENEQFPVLSVKELATILDGPNVAAYTRIMTGAPFQMLKNAAVRAKCTMSSFVYASLFLLLYVYSGKKKLLTPALISDRLLPEYESLIGCLLGSIYLPFRIKEQKTVAAFIEEIHKDILITIQQPIFSHSFLELDGDHLRNCCDMYINYFRKKMPINYDEYILGSHVDVSAIHYPIYCMAIEYNDAIAFVWKYNKHFFKEKMMEDIISCYEALLSRMTVDVDMTISELNALPELRKVTP
jgi:hypothetical protein